MPLPTQWQDALLNSLTVGVPTLPTLASVVNPLSVVAADVDTLLLATNGRLGMAVFNDSNKDLFLSLGPQAASYISYTVKMAPNGYYESPFNFTGEVRGIWAASPTGFARITEVEVPV